MDVVQAYRDTPLSPPSSHASPPSSDASPPSSDASPPSSDASPPTLDDTKRLPDAARARREQNRISARRSRVKRKAVLSVVNTVVDAHTAAIHSLEYKIGLCEDVLRKEIADLERCQRARERERHPVVEEVALEGREAMDEVVREGQETVDEVWRAGLDHVEGFDRCQEPDDRNCAKEKEEDMDLFDSVFMGDETCFVDAMWEEGALPHETVVDHFLPVVSSGSMFEEWL